MSEQFTSTETIAEITCSVCIATYKRPQLLKNLISSLLDQKLPPNISLEIIIVDNDESKGAENVVRSFSCKDAVSLSYYIQPKKNISLTRNLGLKNASGDFIAIVDDDETVDKYWIFNLIETLNKYDADIVFGFVEPVFDPNAPPWAKQRELYMSHSQKTGSIAKASYTTNCLFKTTLLRKYNIEFKPEYGLSGGEDTFFFETLRKKGAKLVYCNEAVSYEIIPMNRTRLKYIFAKSFQGGNTWARNKISLENNAFQIVRIDMFFRGLLGALFFVVKTILLIYDKKKYVKSIKKLSANLGKTFASFNVIYKHY
jgi:succinoglycan biosynthesis protein ExoM